eukprot:44867-Rhodomonas_salina.1
MHGEVVSEMREDSSVLSAKKTPKKGGSRTQDDQVKLASLHPCSDSEFKPAIAFQGAVPGQLRLLPARMGSAMRGAELACVVAGYAFFRGSSGLGYYRDHGPNNLGKVRRSLLDQRGCGTPLLSLSSDVVPLLSLSSDVVQKIWLESEFKPATSFQGAVPGQLRSLPACLCVLGLRCAELSLRVVSQGMRSCAASAGLDTTATTICVSVSVSVCVSSCVDVSTIIPQRSQTASAASKTTSRSSPCSRPGPYPHPARQSPFSLQSPLLNERSIFSAGADVDAWNVQRGMPLFGILVSCANFVRVRWDVRG